jgi:high-affinity iron transporter
MAESFLIALREGFEAALVVAIVLAFVKRQAPEHAKAVWVGTLSALAVATAIGIVLQVTIDGLEYPARQRAFAVICLAAAALLTWMIFWMRKHSRALKGELEAKAGEALVAGSAFTLALVAFSAVLREGLETALFLLSVGTATESSDLVIGTLLGLAAATGLGVLIYQGSHRMNMRIFFKVTGALIIVFAAGLMAKAVLFLQVTGDLGISWDAVYDLTGIHWLTQDSQVGRFLAGIFGWDPRPSIEQVIAFFGYLIPVGWLYFREPKPGVVEPAAVPEPVSAPA